MNDFDSIIKGLDMEEVDETEVVNVQHLSTPELISLQGELTDNLLGRGQGLHPSNQDARDDHSLRNAIQVELARRVQGG